MEGLQISHPALQRIHAYWSEKRGTRIAPTRADMRPEEIHDLLPYVYILDVMGSPQRFQFRLAGTHIVAEYGGEITGKFLDEIDLDDVSSPIHAEYEKAVIEQTPVASSWHFIKNDGRELSYEHLILPLSTDGKTVNMLFCAAVMKGVRPVKSIGGLTPTSGAKPQ